MDIEKVFAYAEVQQLLRAFCALETTAEARAFLEDICTPREILDLAQRLQVAIYLDEGKSYVEVQELTRASSTTVSRVSKALNGPAGGYREMLVKLEDGE